MMGIYLSGTGNTKHCVEKLVNLLDAAAECIPLEAPHVTETLEMQSTIILGYGYPSKACHGSVDTLKQRLTEGNPIIVFIRIPGDTHYAVVVGYDEQHIYLVDSLAENANASDTQYNRVLPTEDFEAVWKTGTLLPDNIYITLEM